MNSFIGIGARPSMWPRQFGRAGALLIAASEMSQA